MRTFQDAFGPLIPDSWHIICVPSSYGSGGGRDAQNDPAAMDDANTPTSTWQSVLNLWSQAFPNNIKQPIHDWPAGFCSKNTY